MKAIPLKAIPLLLCLNGCTPDQVVLIIHVTNATSQGVTELEVSARLDGKQQQAVYTQRLDTLAVTVSKGTLGEGLLSMNLLGVGSKGCSSVGAQFETMLTLNTPYTEVDLTLEPLTQTLCRVPKGSFVMGSPVDEPGRTVGEEEDQHPVMLTTDFWMAESEVTVGQYSNWPPSTANDFPKVAVTWFDALKYCNALSVKEKLQPCYQIHGTSVEWVDGAKCAGYRLPTEAEWEYAANPPNLPRTVWAGCNKIEDLDRFAWYKSSGSPTPNPPREVKTRNPNLRLLYDQSGNVWEWVWDLYPTKQPVPPEPPKPPCRVIRGGSSDTGEADARVARRNCKDPSTKGDYVGFRIVRSSSK